MIAKKSVKKVVKKVAKKAVRRATPGVINVGHFDGELTKITIKGNETIEEAFKEAGINLEDYDDVEINTLGAEVVKSGEKAKKGTTYLLTGNYENGC